MHLYYASLPALESVASQKYSSPLDAVLSEVGTVLTSSQSTTDDKYRAAWASASEERFTPYLKEGVDSIADAPLRATLIALLIGRGDISHVDEYPKLLADFTAQGPLRSNLLAAIRGMKHPATIPVISTLLKSSDVEVRRHAVQALQDNQSPKADLLLKASLQDSDLQVQLNAIHGLAKRHNVPGVTLGLQEFSDHHETYIRNFSKMSVSQTTNR
jgi:HEAT repeat protein